MEYEFHPIVRRLKHLNLVHRIYIQRAAAESGLYFGQPPILDYVSEHDQCTQADLADTLQVSAPSIATSVKRMQKAGLLKKISDENDLRCNRISLTDKGFQVSAKCRERFHEIDARMFNGFTREECEALCGYLDRMSKNISADEFSGKTMFALITTAEEEQKRNFGKQEEILHD